MRYLREGLLNILHAKDEFCQLCFNSVDEGALRMQDEVATNLQPAEVEELGSVLTLVVGVEVTNKFTPMDRVCEECFKLTLICYTFIKSCQEKANDFSNAIECVTKSLDNLEKLDKCKSLFISINLKESACSTYCDYKKCNTKSDVLKQFKYHTNPKPRIKEKAKITESDSNFYLSQHQFKDFTSTETSDMNCLPTPLPGNDKYSVIKLEDGRKRYYCKLCNKECYRLYNILRHYKNAHERKPKHIRRNEPMHNSWICHNCGKIFKDRAGLRQHEQVHSGIQCPKCNKFYKNNHYFMRHLCVPNLGERPKLDKNFVCDQCGVKFGRKNTLLLHIKFEHGNGVPHVCSWCNKKFYALSQLKTHIIKHTKEKDFKCEQCNGRFVTKESLLYHVRTHTGEKPYKCRFCEKHFLSTSRRADHVRIHHMEPSIPCNICKKLFKTHSQVNKHKKLHQDPKSSLYIGNTSSGIN